MYLRQQILFIPLLLFFQIRFNRSEFNEVRDFAEEMAKAAKGMTLTDLSNYFVDFAHLNGFVVIPNEQYVKDEEEVASPADSNAQELAPIGLKRKIMVKEEESDPKNPSKKVNKIKILKKVDEMALSNHHSITTSSTLLPSPYPKELFEKAIEVQKLMADLHYRVSFDVEFLQKCTEEAAKTDSLIAGMLKIMNRVEKEGRRNPITLIIQRSDYLTAETKMNPRIRKHHQIELKQIEVTNSIGKGQGDGHLITKIHERMLEKIKQTYEKDSIPEWLKTVKVEKNPVIEGQAKALYMAYKAFVKRYEKPDAVILYLSVPKRKGYCHFEQTLWQQFKLEDIAWAEGERPQVEFLQFDQMSTKLSLSGKDRHLYYREKKGDKKKVVAIAYFQDGFIPEHFKNEEEWKIREEMELSNAIMSPSAYMHLLGSKTVQTELAKKGKIEEYYANDDPLFELIPELQSTFIKMYQLGKNDKDIVAKAIEKNKDYVLKANTDGGKGNFFDDKMVEQLKKMKNDEKERSKYILQKRITPFRMQNAIIPQPPEDEKSIVFVEMDTEVSIFGSLLAINNDYPKGATSNLKTSEKSGKPYKKPNETIFNNYDGYFIRTKLSTNAQCNMSMGQGGTDSLVLFPMERFTKISQSSSTFTSTNLNEEKIVSD